MTVPICAVFDHHDPRSAESLAARKTQGQDKRFLFLTLAENELSQMMVASASADWLPWTVMTAGKDRV